jgi:hypothetical protein
MYVKRNNDVRSYNPCCIGKAKSITYSESECVCVFVFVCVCVCARVCVCSLLYPACNAHAPYCHLGPVRLHNILPHYLINGTIFEKQYKKGLLIFSTIISETFLILRSTEQDMIKYVYWSSCKILVILLRF